MRVVFFLFLFVHFTSSGQSIIQSILEAPILDFEYEEIAASQSYLNSANFNSPWLREVDFRVRTRNDATIEEYRMRFGLLNPMEIRANKQYQDVLEETLGLRKEVRKKKIIAQRMALIIERIRLEMRLAQADSTIAFLKNIREILLSESDENIVDDLIEIEDDIFKAQLDKQDFTSRYEINTFLVQQRIGLGVNTRLDSADFVTIERMSEDILTLGAQNSQLALADQELKLEQSLFSIKKAETWSNIGFVQAEYDVDRGNNFNDHLGYQIGITLPIFNSKKPDLRRDKLELIEEETQQKATKSAMLESFDLGKMRFSNQLKNWQLSKDYQNQLLKIEQIGLESVKSIIAFNKRKQALEKWQVNALAEIWLTYTQLSMSNANDGVFFNYLTKRQEEINILSE
ncbi:MAG: hypothetical protein RIA69_04680 [Cyclobacteriaceae bacterium]